MSSGVNMLTNGFKISDTTETEPFELILFQSDEKMCQKNYPADWRNLSDRLTCWLSVSNLTWGFLGI